MRNIKKIFIVVFSLILLFAVSCSNDDKTGINNNPPEDTEITDGKTGGSGTGSSEEGDSGTETGGGTGTSGGTGGSGEGEGGTETPSSDPETTETIDAKDFPEDLKGLYAHSKIEDYDINVSYNEDKGQTCILAKLIDGSDGITVHTIWVEKWTKTTKGGKITKLECKTYYNGSLNYTITFNCESETKTISGAYFINNEICSSFSGTKK